MAKRKRKQQKEPTSDLPEDVMTEILMRLPFDSIKTLSCVSKHWQSVIDRPDFLHRYIKSNKVTTFSCNNTLYSFSITTNRHRYPQLSLRRIPVKNETWVWSWCGMAAFDHSYGGTLFCNLLAGTSYKVKRPPEPLDELQLTSSWQYLGVAYDAHDRDYKLAVQNTDSKLFWIYSFKSLVWKLEEGYPHGKYTCHPLGNFCSFNGVIHWSVSSTMIVTYDVHSCRFGEMSVPAVIKGYNLMGLGGELCSWKDKGRGVIDLWVMKEYGIHDSWTRLARIDKRRFNNKQIAPVTQCECEDGRRFVLVVSRKDGSLYWYNIQNNRIRVIKNSS